MSCRSEFPTKVRQKAWERCGGRCEASGCGIKLQVGKFQFDHIVPDGLGGKPDLENCQVLCTFHHARKTHQEDRPVMDKADSIRKKHLGIKTKTGFRRPPPGYNPWTRRIET